MRHKAKSSADLPPPPSSNWKAAVRSGYAVLAVSLGLFFGWAVLARLDAAVLAPGIVSVESNRKTIQHLEGGIVREIIARDGALVAEGEVLIRLDPTRTQSMGELYKHQLAIQLAQEARLLAEREGADTIRFPEEVNRQTGIDLVARAINDQTRQFAGKRETMLRAIEVAAAQIAQATQELQQNNNDNKTARAQIVSITAELQTVRELYEKKLVALPRLSALEREQLRLAGIISNTELGATKLQERIQELTLRRDQARGDYQQDASNQLVEVRKSISELRQQVTVTTDAQTRIEVRSPTKGIVQQMRVFTVGGVVRPGDPILDVVPISDNLIIKARIAPIDADRIAPNMEAEVRFPSFRNLGLAIVLGKLTAVSRDRLVDETTKEPYFDAQVSTPRTAMPDVIADKLVAGMPAEVIIPTGERTVLSYLMMPLMERFRTSMRER